MIYATTCPFLKPFPKWSFFWLNLKTCRRQPYITYAEQFTSARQGLGKKAHDFKYLVSVNVLSCHHMKSERNRLADKEKGKKKDTLYQRMSFLNAFRQEKSNGAACVLLGICSHRDLVIFRLWGRHIARECCLIALPWEAVKPLKYEFNSNLSSLYITYILLPRPWLKCKKSKIKIGLATINGSQTWLLLSLCLHMNIFVDHLRSSGKGPGLVRTSTKDESSKS